MGATRDWKLTQVQAEQLEASLARLVDPIAALFVDDASQPRQRRRLELVGEALRRLGARAQRELEHEAATRERLAEQQARLSDWRGRVDELRAEDGRSPMSRGGGR